MARHRSRRRSSHGSSHRPLVAFLLIASFGILFAGCSGPSDSDIATDEFTFTEDDVARFRELVKADEEGNADMMLPEETASGMVQSEPSIRLDTTQQEEIPVLDLSNVEKYTAIRTGFSATGDDIYRVTNTFLNVRAAPKVTGEPVETLDKGDPLKVLEFIDAAWAKVELTGGGEGYVSTRYIAKLTSEEKLAAERAKFDGQYFVNFGFLNVRKDPDSNSEKIGELQGQTIIRPISTDEVWARVPFDGKEGYVAVQYLSPFLPNFLVRQDTYTLPILHYQLVQDEVLTILAKHLDALKKAGVRIITLQDFHDLILSQEDRDVRLDPKTVVVAISHITADNVKEVSDLLRVSNVQATLFLQTNEIGIDGITEKTILTMLANGLDLQSGGHTGDDMRSLTNAQIELELKQSRKILEQMTKKDVFAIGYPWGGANDRVMSIASEAGYLLGVGAAPERTFKREHLLQMPSFVVTNSLTSEEMLKIATGE